MTLEQTLNALKNTLGGKSDEAKALAEKVTALEATILANAEALAGAEAIKAVAAELTTKVATLEAELSKAIELNTLLKTAKTEAEGKIESAGKKAAAIAASVGVEPVEVSPAVFTEKSKTPQDIADEWVALKQTDPKAAREFYDRNLPALKAAAGLR